MKSLEWQAAAVALGAAAGVCWWNHGISPETLAATACVCLVMALLRRNLDFAGWWRRNIAAAPVCKHNLWRAGCPWCA